MQGHIRRRHKPDCAHRLSSGKARCNCPHQARYRLDGKFIERTFRTGREADDWLTAQKAALLSGTHTSPRLADTKFGVVVEEWRKSWPNRLSPTTAARYTSILDNYLIPTFGTTPMGRIEHGAVQRYVNKLAAERKPAHPASPADKPDADRALHAPGTVLNVYAVLRTAMNQGVKLGMVKANPCTAIDLPRPAKEEMLFLTPAEVTQLAEKIDAHYRVLVYVAAYTGLRAGELAGLQRQDADLLRGVLHVRRALKDVNGHLELGPTKTHQQRTVALPKFLVSLLQEHLAADTKGGTGPEAHVFTMKSGSLLRHGLFYGRYFKRAVAGYTDSKGTYHPGALPASKHKLRFHDLRHTAASLAIHAGANPLLVSKQLGHSTVTITLDRYSHLMPSVAEAVAVQLDALYNAQPEPAPSNVVQISANAQES
jgi:integrase